MALKLLALAAAVGLASAGIYPDDHWNYASKLSNDEEFDAEIAKAVEGDQTLFVRWIASEGWGWWVKQAPSWNEQCKKFAGNPDVVFADVLLSGGGPRGGEGVNPGAGGWPTIRYYNKETGVLGKSYEKKTSDSMCDELGPKGGLMQAYIEEAGNTSDCMIEEPYTGCGEKQKKFIGIMASKPADVIVAQTERLNKMKGSKMKDDLKEWLGQRLAILKQFTKAAAKTEL